MVSTFVRIALDRPGRARNDDVARLRWVELRGGVQDQAAATADHRARPFGGYEFHHQLAADRIAASGEHIERRDHIERVESVEQHDLRVHAAIFGPSGGAR